MKCPADPVSLLRCNQILDVAEHLITTQGIVSFKFSQIAHDVGCSTGTLYKHFKGKEDILVCLFMRHATSNHLSLCVQQHPELTEQQKVLLPIFFTFETIKRSPIFFTLRSVSVNHMVWPLASDEKVARFKRRINAFWGWLQQTLMQAVAKQELSASPLQVKELTQGIVFYLTGILTQFESQLIDEEFLSAQQHTCFRHLAKLMSQYGWKQPVDLALFDSLLALTQQYFVGNQSFAMNCSACNALEYGCE
ncbi:TetR/AcrR family transcriptional regulator [Shewanella sp. NIFS-20-20]|uniref:TetR/AcrR family transcriptional regulator n=1 Tax=Shewanella sp. NIFS-20-20 TaxID=2853806 RepID=UPI001C4839D5|nr:TetR/AcrR family transcriptional regulator [Shewanella sp. NIFS-20-20]MBV7316770.1 TetR/AcrR family transcriptional regulator [Shewanella sp. NIFS-20-20]